MTKTAFEKQAARLADLRCPIHGTKMKCHSTVQGSGTIYVFECATTTCDVRGSAAAASGPVTLDERFSYLVDPNVGQLPLQTHNQERGLRAADVASIALSRLAFVHRVETGSDIGIDFICELRDKHKPTGKMFNVQCKALPSTFDVGEESISFQIKVSTARYWLEQAHPTILMVADPDTGEAYWCDPVGILLANTSDWRTQGDVSIPVLKASQFSCFTIPPESFRDKIAQGVAKLGSSLRERLYTVEKIIDNEITTGVNRLSKDVGYLLLDRGSPVTEAIRTIESVTNFQNVILEKILVMITDISSIIAKLHEDSYRRYHAMSGAKGSFAESADFIEERKILDKGAAFAGTVRGKPESVGLKDAIAMLDTLETLHRVALDREADYEFNSVEDERLHDLRSAALHDDPS